MNAAPFSFRAAGQVVEVSRDGRVIYIGHPASSEHAKALAAEREGTTSPFRGEQPSAHGRCP